MATKRTALTQMAVPGKPKTFTARTPIAEAVPATRDEPVRYALMTGAFHLTDELTDELT